MGGRGGAPLKTYLVAGRNQRKTLKAKELPLYFQAQRRRRRKVGQADLLFFFPKEGKQTWARR